MTMLPQVRDYYAGQSVMFPFANSLCGLFNLYKRSAAKRGHEFRLSPKEFEGLIRQPSIMRSILILIALTFSLCAGCGGSESPMHIDKPHDTGPGGASGYCPVMQHYYQECNGCHGN